MSSDSDKSHIHKYNTNKKSEYDYSVPKSQTAKIVIIEPSMYKLSSMSTLFTTCEGKEPGLQQTCTQETTFRGNKKGEICLKY